MSLNRIGPITVSNAEVTILALNRARRWATIQNTSANPIRIAPAVAGTPIDATMGIRLAQGERLTLDYRDPSSPCPSDKIVAIREGGSDGIATALEQVDNA